MIKVTLITGRSINQGEAIEAGKELDIYTNSAGVCELDPADMEKLGASEGDTLRVSTFSGEVFVKAVKSRQYPHEGIAFIPMGPWANAVVDFDTSSTGMPSFKGIAAKIELTRDEKVLSARELVRERYLKFKMSGGQDTRSVRVRFR
ncbi:MAG: molybdopterin dinucleotide binding domain-containing protein [Methanobacteriota archaeon]